MWCKDASVLKDCRVSTTERCILSSQCMRLSEESFVRGEVCQRRSCMGRSTSEESEVGGVRPLRNVICARGNAGCTWNVLWECTSVESRLGKAGVWEGFG